MKTLSASQAGVLLLSGFLILIFFWATQTIASERETKRGVDSRVTAMRNVPPPRSGSDTFGDPFGQLPAFPPASSPPGPAEESDQPEEDEKPKKEGTMTQVFTLPPKPITSPEDLPDWLVPEWLEKLRELPPYQPDPDLELPQESGEDPGKEAGKAGEEEEEFDYDEFDSEFTEAIL